MEDGERCPECHAGELRVTTRIIDIVSGEPMPGATRILFGALSVVLGIYLVVLPVHRIDEPGWWAVVLIGAGLIFGAVYTGWLLLFGQPVRQYELCCRECYHTWIVREDEQQEAPRVRPRLV